MSPKVIKDPDKLLELLDGLRAQSIRAFFYLVLNHEPFKPFVCTHSTLSFSLRIRHPHPIMEELVKRGLVKKEFQGNKSLWTILVDVIS